MYPYSIFHKCKSERHAKEFFKHLVGELQTFDEASDLVPPWWIVEELPGDVGSWEQRINASEYGLVFRERLIKHLVYKWQMWKRKSITMQAHHDAIKAIIGQTHKAGCPMDESQARNFYRGWLFERTTP